MVKLVTISELSKILGLIDPNTKKPLNYILRYWEKCFKQIKSKKINNRRYYSNSEINKIRMIKYLIKNKGMTITGVKKILNMNINKLDELNEFSLKTDLKNSLKLKSKLILKKLNKLKRYGQKNSSESKNGSRK